jgi:hypothetical protein
VAAPISQVHIPMISRNVIQKEPLEKRFFSFRMMLTDIRCVQMKREIDASNCISKRQTFAAQNEDDLTCEAGHTLSIFQYVDKDLSSFSIT